MKKISLFYLIMIMLVFVPLLLSFVFGGYGSALNGQIIPISFGIFSYSLILINIFLSTRPKFFEKKLGLQNIYAIHGIFALFLLLSAAAHIGLEVTKVIITNVNFSTTLLGILGFLFLIVATLVGIFNLTVIFISKFPKLMKRKDQANKREQALWLHRLSICGMIILFFHVISIPAIRVNRVFIFLLFIYASMTLIYYILTKMKYRSNTHVLKKIELATRDVYKLYFTPIKNQVFTYTSGQYIFVRYTDSSLPKESHPFSLVSAPSEGNQSLIIMVKQSGDYTKKLNQLNPGDKVAVEGPYGNFWNDIQAAKRNPVVFLAGGIGITPYLSILKELLISNSKRVIQLVWGVATIDDVFDLVLFKEFEQNHPNFHFHLILSKKSGNNYSFGHINDKYLSKIGINQLYTDADFFICGPNKMMSAMKSILTDNSVEPSRIHIEKFSF